ncbi:MAG: TIGR02117 family protein [Planctomycetes bacterium]|nr:TIGR02117 family protein [Planctomycetota bacterium]
MSVRVLLASFAFVVLYALAVWIGGSIAVNRGWQQAREGIEIRVWSNGLHVDFVLPIATRHVDWRAFAPLQNPSGPNEWQGYINLGWGDHDFYVLTPTEADFSYAVAGKAIFWPTAAVMHLKYLPWMPEPGERCVKLVLNDEEYQRLVTYVQRSFALQDGRPKRIAGACYGTDDAFFEAVGSYHLFSTCNNWANAALKTAGVRTALWAPLEYAVFRHLENR